MRRFLDTTMTDKKAAIEKTIAACSSVAWNYHRTRKMSFLRRFFCGATYESIGAEIARAILDVDQDVIAAKPPCHRVSREVYTGTTIEDCDFLNCTVNGEPIWNNTEPKIFHGNNIAWPPGWSLEETTQWRKERGLLPSDRS